MSAEEKLNGVLSTITQEIKNSEFIQKEIAKADPLLSIEYCGRLKALKELALKVLKYV